MARLAQSAERKALNLVVVGSSPTVGVVFSHIVKLLHSDKGITMITHKFLQEFGSAAHHLILVTMNTFPARLATRISEI